MANRYWVGGTGAWNGVSAGKWSLTSGGASGQAEPTASDDVFFDAASGAVTVTVSTTNGKCLSLNFTGFTGTFAGATVVDCSGSLTLGAGMTFTHTGGFNMLATSGTKNITTNSISLTGLLTISGAGGTFQLQDNLVGTRLIITDGVFDANNKNVTLTGTNCFIFGGVTTRSVLMGSGTWTLSAVSPFDCSGGTTNLTFTASTSTVKLTNTSASDMDFDCASITLYNVWFSRGTSTGAISINRNIAASPTFHDFKDDGTGAHTIKFRNGQTYTFTTFTVSGTPTTNITITSDTTATHTLSCASGTINSRHVTISYSTAQGGATWNATDSTNSGNNSGWNFLAGDRYWVGGANTWDGTAGTKWASISGGTGGETVPTSSNNVYLDSGSGAIAVTLNSSVTCKNLTLTGFTGTLAGSTALAIAGNLVSASTFTFTYSGTMTFSVTSSITTAGSTLACPIVFDGVGQTFSLVDALVSSSTITLTNGTFNLTNLNVTCSSFSSSNSNTRVLTLGSGTLEVNGTGTVFNVATATNLTVNANTSTIKLTNSSSSSKTFAGGGKTFNNFWNATGSTGVTIITGSNTFNDFRSSGDSRTIQFTAATTTTFTTLTVTGIAFTLTSVTSATHTLSCLSGTILVQNATISYSIATGGATFKAPTTYSNVNGGNNTGWSFSPIATSPMLLLLDSIV